MKCLLVAAALSISSTTAFSADLVKPSEPTSSARISWSGWEFGVGAGLSYSSLSNNYNHTPYDARGNTVCTDAYNQSMLGYTNSSNCSSDYVTYGNVFKNRHATLQSKLSASYSWQRGNYVYGISAERFFNRKAASSETPWYDTFQSYITVSSGIRPEWAVKGKLGVAIDRYLPFLTMGVAWAKVDTAYLLQGVYYNPNNFTPVSVSSRKLQSGLVLGGGLKYALAENWNVQIEYNYTRFARSSISSPASYVNGFSSYQNYPSAASTLSSTTHSMLVGLAYRL
jgi:opacity protein-like surface antigen